MNLKISTYTESEFLKTHSLYFNSGATYGREADTIIVFALKTPTGRWSKYTASLRFNAERNITNKMERIKQEYIRLGREVFNKEIKKGYSIGEIILYSGKLE